MQRIEPGWYRELAFSKSFDVYRSTTRRCTDRALKQPNRWGSHTSASYRMDTDWSYKIGDRIVVGFGSKRAAVKAARQYIEERDRT